MLINLFIFIIKLYNYYKNKYEKVLYNKNLKKNINFVIYFDLQL